MGRATSRTGNKETCYGGIPFSHHEWRTAALRGRLIWSDEFDGAAGSPPDPAHWRHEIGWVGVSNGESQRYSASLENAFQDGQSNLVIRASKMGSGFTSARLTTKGLIELKFGRIECRAKLPRGAGLWSAFWALGNNIDSTSWPGCGEIDIFESIGSQPQEFLGTVHCPGHSKEAGIGGRIETTNVGDVFRVFAVEWWPNRITWSIDGVAYHEVDKNGLGVAWVFDHPFFLLLNLAVGGWLGGDVSNMTTFPANLTVDYVRWFELPPDV
jgi:beta-glucanase (GH16 family)